MPRSETRKGEKRVVDRRRRCCLIFLLFCRGFWLSGLSTAFLVLIILWGSLTLISGLTALRFLKIFLLAADICGGVKIGGPFVRKGLEGLGPFRWAYPTTGRESEREEKS
jgi:hypothetical protein